MEKVKLKLSTFVFIIFYSLVLTSLCYAGNKSIELIGDMRVNKSVDLNILHCSDLDGKKESEIKKYLIAVGEKKLLDENKIQFERKNGELTLKCRLRDVRFQSLFMPLSFLQEELKKDIRNRYVSYKMMSFTEVDDIYGEVSSKQIGFLKEAKKIERTTIIFGEAHSDQSVKKLLIDNLPQLVQSGFTTLGVEFLIAQEQELLDQYIKTGKMERKLETHLNSMKIYWGSKGVQDITLKDVIIAAKNAGIKKIVALDSELAMRTGGRFRLDLQNAIVAEALMNDKTEGGILILEGDDHLFGLTEYFTAPFLSHYNDQNRQEKIEKYIDPILNKNVPTISQESFLTQLFKSNNFENIPNIDVTDSKVVKIEIDNQNDKNKLGVLLKDRFEIFYYNGNIPGIEKPLIPYFNDYIIDKKMEGGNRSIYTFIIKKHLISPIW